MRNKHGSGSIVIAIILSALILVEGIYLSLIIDINRRVTIERALKIEVDTILAKYSEELFVNYGFYAFLLDDVDDYAFNSAIEATGYIYGEDIYIDGYKTINTSQIKDAISNYYAYRTPGLIINEISDYFSYIVEELDGYDFFSNLRKFKTNYGSVVLNTLTKGASTINDLLGSETLAELIELTDSDSSLVIDFLNLYSDMNSSNIDFDDDFDPSDMFAMSFFNQTIDMFDNSSEIIEDNFFNLYLSHYCVYNFECCVKDFENIEGEFIEDRNIHGTKFSELNDERCNDVEYLITGFSDWRGKSQVGFLIFPMIQLTEVLNCFMDKEFMNVCGIIAEILSDIFAVLLEGVKIPKWLFEMVIIQYYSLAVTVKDVIDLFNGKNITAFKIDRAPEPFNQGINMNYKDFAYVLSVFPQEIAKLNRIEKLMENKYGNLITDITIGTIYRGDYYYAQQGYELYGF